MAWTPTPGTTLDGAVDAMSAAAADLRPNDLLDDVFAADGPTAPAGGDPSGPADLRPNDLLDDALGFGPGPAPPAATPPGGVPAPSSAAGVPTAPVTPAPTPPVPTYGFAPDPGPFDPTARPTAPLVPPGSPATAPPAPTYGLAPDPTSAPIPLAPPPVPAAPLPDPYAVHAPPTLPAPPNLPPPGTGPAAPAPGPPGSSGGVGPGDVPRLVKEIRDATLRLVERAAKAGSATPGPPAPPEKAAAPGYGWGDATRPITDWARGTRVGRIAETAYKRLKPAFQAMNGGKEKGPKSPPKAKTPKPPSPAGTPPGGGPPKVPTPGTAGGAGAGAGTGGAAAGEAAGAALGASEAIPVVGAVVAATAALIALAKAGVDLAYQQEGRARELAESNADQAAAVAQLDVARVRRSQESGAATANSSAANLDALDRFEDTIRPIKDTLDTLKNIVGGVVVETLTILLEPLKEPIQACGEAAEEWLGKREQTATFQDQLDQIARDAAARRAAGGAGDAARRAMGR